MFIHLLPESTAPQSASSTRHFASEVVRPSPRFDMYITIHKALRAAMSDTLVRLGRIDVADSIDREQALAQVEQLLGLVTDHLHHEDRFIHPAIESRRPGGSAAAHEDHLRHIHSMAMLGFGIAALRQADADHAAAQALVLYRHLARFVAETLEHLDDEETTLNALLWELFSDDELIELHDRMLASIEPAFFTAGLRWAVPASSPAERAELLNGLKALMPPDAMQGILAMVRPHLDTSGWAKLTLAIGEGAASPAPPEEVRLAR